jgi:hypothetical protein
MLPTRQIHTMPNATAKLCGRVGVALNNAVSPGVEEWDAYLAMASEGMKAAGGVARFKQLIVTDGGGPNAAQRKAVMELASRYGDPAAMKIAVVSNSVGVRGIVTAFNWLGAPLRAFSPTQLGEAFAYLNVPDDAVLELCRVISELGASVAGGVASSAGAADMARSYTRRVGR